jgi:hypothetical protein
MQSVAQFFGLTSSSELGWAHRVNTLGYLTAAASNPDIHVVEGDVQFTEQDAVPHMGHRPGLSELDLPTFLTTSMLGNKAVKLDFHTPAAIEPALAILRVLRTQTPVILHADVFALLGEAQDKESLEPEQFIRLCQQSCPKAVISLGWSLKRTHDADGRVEDALIQQMAAMALQRLGPVSYGIEFGAGYSNAADGANAERGAAMILDPLPEQPTPLSTRIDGAGTNVVNIIPRLRQVA